MRTQVSADGCMDLARRRVEGDTLAATAAKVTAARSAVGPGATAGESVPAALPCWDYSIPAGSIVSQTQTDSLLGGLKIEPNLTSTKHTSKHNIGETYGTYTNRERKPCNENPKGNITTTNTPP